MPTPIKALRYGQLKRKTEGLAVPTSGHQVLKMEFVDSDGQVVTGFYKELIPDGVGDGSYPELLAKYSVAVSVLMRAVLGDRAAEDRLVFDEAGRIKGTFSINLEKYKPLYSYGQGLPSDPQERELVCPSVQTLLQYNVAELLVSAWRIKCDDRHPGNFSLFGLIDWDMALYPYTYIMKGKRLVDGLTKDLPEKGMKLMSKELDNFPNIDGRTHTPTNSWPGNANIWKRYQAYTEFQALAKNPGLKTEEGIVTWQEQFFSALLKELLTFDPEMLRARLTEYFGEDLRLDYLSLPKAKSEQLAKTHPVLFNEKADDEPFVEHMMHVFQAEYDELYSAVIRYMGCAENASGVPVVDFNRFLRNKPSAFRKVLKWAEAYNEKMSESWQRYEANPKTPTGLSSAPGSHANPPESRYSIERMRKRYFQIWRDVHAPVINAIIEDGDRLICELANELRRTKSLPPIATETKDLESPLTESHQLVGEPHLLKESTTLECDPNSNLKKGLENLQDFVFKLHQCTKDYYATGRDALCPEHNQAFCNKISSLINESETHVLTFLMTTPWAAKFVDCISHLQQFYNGLHFERHCLAQDQPFDAAVMHDYRALLTRPHTDEEVVLSCLRTLFAWVKTMDKETFNGIVLQTIKEDYQPQGYTTFWTARYRGEAICAYLKTTPHDSADRLGSILSEGGTTSTSLNTRLIMKLIPIMLEATPAQIDINLLSVRHAIEHKLFNAEYYTQKAQDYVQNSSGFTFVGSKQNIAEFSDVMFDWVQKQDAIKLRALVRKVLNLYAPYTFSIWSPKARVPEINGYLNEVPRHPNPQLMALILSNGGNEETSFNTLLLKEIVVTMRADVDSQKKQDVPNLEIVSKISPERLSDYGKKLKDYIKISKDKVGLGSHRLTAV